MSIAPPSPPVFGSETYLSVPKQQQLSSLRRKSRRSKAPTKITTETNFFLSLQQVIGWPPRRISLLYLASAKGAPKDRWLIGICNTCPNHRMWRAQIISEDVCLQSTHDHEPHHCSPHIPTGHEQYLGDTGVIRLPKCLKAAITFNRPPQRVNAVTSTIACHFQFAEHIPYLERYESSWIVYASTLSKNISLAYSMSNLQLGMSSAPSSEIR